MLNYPEWTQLNSFCINSLQALYNDLSLMPALVSSLLIFTLLSWMTFCHLWPSGGSGIFAPLPKKKKQNNVMIIKWLTYLNLMRVLVIRMQLTTVTPIFNHELLRARPTTLQTTIQVLSWSQSSLPHLTHFATHEG